MTKPTSRIWSLATFAVLVTFLASLGASGTAVARPIAASANPSQRAARPFSESRPSTSPQLAEYKQGKLVSYVEPQETLQYRIARQKLGPNASPQQLEAAAKEYLQDWHRTAYHGPDPKAYQKLLHNEQVALAANSTPAALGLAVTGTLRLLTIAVEFNGTDTAPNFSHPISVDDSTCITETVSFTGPLHNQIASPGPRDNNSFWLANFDRSYYEKLIFSTTGITERVRLDLTDPEDGKPGIDISGGSMRNYYNEVSGGRVQFDGGPQGVIAWVQVPHSEGYYGATACIDGVSNPVQAGDGLPQNPRDESQLLVDTVDAINASDPSFPWADYDTNGDGALDHVIIFHAGADKADGGGAQSYHAIWSHRGNVDPADGGYVADDRGTPDPADDIKLNGYTMQSENAALGVLVHEFGHDLGHPDLYDITVDESDVVWWDLMSTGSHTGKLFQTSPTNMSAWTKTALGWADPQVINPTAAVQTLKLGQTSRPPNGTAQAVRVNLPPNVVTDTLLLPGSTQAWWTNNDAAWADIRLTRDLNLTGVTAPISVSFDLDGAAEEDWDYLFVEVSVDGGLTYTQTKGFEVGSDDELTTPDSYADPNKRLADYGGLRYGYTGDTGGWLRAYHDLSAYAGQNIKLRFHYATDAAFQERGYFIDNIVIQAGANVLLNDPVEGGNANGWTPTVDSFTIGELPSAGWVQTAGVRSLAQYYLLEWRNADGFDKGLLYTYNTVFFEVAANGGDEWYVDHVPSNIPGMLVWLRDTRFGGEPFGADNAIVNTSNQFLAGPSDGPKGGLLIVDAHPAPLRSPANSTIDFDFGAVPFPPYDNWSGRVQTTNAAFSLQPSRPYTLTLSEGAEDPATTILTPTLVAPQSAVSAFHDALGYYPGVEALPQPLTTYSDPTTAPFLRIKGYTFSDPDASVVVPAKDYYPPRTPAGFTGAGFETSPPAANVSTFETAIIHDDDSFESWSVGDPGGVNVVGQQTGNPGSHGVQYGYHFQILGQASNGSYGTIRLWNGAYAGQATTTFSESGMTKPLTVTIALQNTGSPAALTLYSDFDESRATYVEGSATNGAVPVRATQAQVAAALRSGGANGLRALAVDPAQAIAVVWTSPSALETGDTGSFSYALSRKPGVAAARIVNLITGPSFSDSTFAQFGSIVFAPVARK